MLKSRFNMQISNSVIRQIVILLIIFGLGCALFVNLSSFFPALLGAYTIYILLRQFNINLTKRHRWNPKLAAFFLMLISFLVIALPIYFVGDMIYSSHALAIDQYTTIFASIKDYIEGLEQKYKVDLIDEKTFSQLSEWITATVQNILSSTINGIASIAMTYFLLYFMLTEWKDMEKNLLHVLPLSNQNSATVRRQLNKLVYSNAIGIPVIAIVQGIAGLIMYIILGVPNPFLWFFLTCIASMLPILGSALAYIPITILFFTMNMPTKAIIILLYGIIVIGSVDNIFRIWLQNRLGDTHPMVTLLGVIVGAQLFGFIGLIFGPILISLFLLFISIYRAEFSPNHERVEQN